MPLITQKGSVDMIINNTELKKLLKDVFHISKPILLDGNISSPAKRGIQSVADIICYILSELEYGDYCKFSVKDKAKAFDLIVSLESIVMRTYKNQLKGKKVYAALLEKYTLFDVRKCNDMANNRNREDEGKTRNLISSGYSFLDASFWLVNCKCPYLNQPERKEDEYGVTYNSLTVYGQRAYEKITDILSAFLDIPCLLDCCDELINSPDY